MKISCFPKMLSVWRFLPFLEFQHIMIVWLVIAIVLFSLVLSTCTSTSTANQDLYLTYLSYQSISPSTSSAQANPELKTTFAALVNGSSLEVRVGYFGLCVRCAGGIWLCSSDSAGLARQFQPYQDPLNLIRVAAVFRESIISSGLMIAAVALSSIAICLLLTFPGWHEEVGEDGSTREVKPFPSRPVSLAALAASTLASILALVSMTWQHTASVAAAITAHELGYAAVKSGVGAKALALGWVGFALLTLTASYLLLTVWSINVLNRSTDE